MTTEPDVSATVQAVVDRGYALAPGWAIDSKRLFASEEGRALLALSSADRAAAVVDVIARNTRMVSAGRVTNYAGARLHGAIYSRLVRARLPFTTEQLREILDHLVRWQSHHLVALGPLARAIAAVSGDGLPDSLRPGLVALRALAAQDEMYAEGRKNVALIDGLLRDAAEDDDGVRAQLLLGPFGHELRAWYDGLPTEKRPAWDALLAHCAGYGGRPRPAKTWVKKAAPLVEALGADALREQLRVWMEAVPLGAFPASALAWGFEHETLTVESDAATWAEARSYPVGARKENQELIGALLWTSAPHVDEAFARDLTRFCHRCFKKIKDIGMGSERMGKGALWALGEAPGGVGLPYLSQLASSVRYAAPQKVIRKTLQAAADAQGLTQTDIEEIAVPTADLDARGVRRVTLGDHTAVLAIGGKKATLTFETADGTVRKGVPKAVKDDHADALKALKRDRKELDVLLGTLVARLEGHWLADRSLPLPIWKARYLDHPVVGALSQQLIWDVGEGRAALWRDGAPRDASGAEVPVSDDTTVRLWHPVRSGSDAIAAWRDRLADLDLVQPFRQAWRETYLLTPAEEATRVYSNRFAAHLIKQGTLLALAPQRGWGYRIQGRWDGWNVPTRAVPAADLEAVFHVEGFRSAEDPGHYAYLSTDFVAFTRAGERVPLDTVPPVVFSEILRDVDLFVSVGSVGNDPTWQDGVGTQLGDAARQAWRNYAFGELTPSAETRRDVLEKLLPRLKLGKVCRIEGRFLHVQGKRFAYRIHLGSAAVHLEPQNQYLCIVATPPKRSARLALPFDEDRQLSIILSKAKLLAADDRITDPTILAQLPADGGV